MWEYNIVCSFYDLWYLLKESEDLRDRGLRLRFYVQEGGNNLPVYSKLHTFIDVLLFIKNVIHIQYSILKNRYFFYSV